MGLTDMGPVELQPGHWYNLEIFYGKVPKTVASFQSPAGVQLKVRYGWGRWGSWNSQQQTTDGKTVKQLRVSGFVGRARMEAKVTRTAVLSWKRVTEGPAPS